MPITDLLEANAKKYPNEVSLVEINPDIQEKRRVTWRDYELIESSPMCHYRREITWHVFDEKANRFAQAFNQQRDWKRGQSGDFIDELLGMASDLFWYIKDRSTGGAA